MSRKPLLSLLVLLLVLLAPAMGEAKVTAAQVIGTMTSGNPSDADIDSWMSAATVVIIIFNEGNLEGLDEVGREVMRVLDGGRNTKLDEILPTRLDRIRFLVCDQEWKCEAMKHVGSRQSQLEELESIDRMETFLEKNVSGFRTHAATLGKIAQWSTVQAMKRLE